MARERSPNRDKAYQIWLEHNGNITNRQIADMLDDNEKVIAVWKQRDKWNVVQQSKPLKNKVVQQKKKDKKKQQKDVEVSVVEEDQLTEKQRLFCLYYVKYFNATKAYQKAYDCTYQTANANGSRMLVNASVINEIDRIKKEQATGVKLDAHFVLQKYIDIAFADISDYVTFGQRQEQVIGMYGPVYEGEGEDKKPVMQTVNYVDIKESSMVDGSIISEVKQGKDGVSIKLADKMKALEVLTKYLDLLPDHHKRMIEDKKLEIEQEHLQLAKKKAKGDGDNEKSLNSLDQLADAIRKSAEVIKGE